MGRQGWVWKIPRILARSTSTLRIECHTCAARKLPVILQLIESWLLAPCALVAPFRVYLQQSLEIFLDGTITESVHVWQHVYGHVTI